jgi:hypothetical protein
VQLCSNALYGFTGAGASPQQALPLADSCLSLGAASCKRAVELVRTSFERAQVIYAQTDSVFVQFQGASIDEAIALGTQAADIVSQAFTSPMVLKFERVRDLSIDVFCFMGDSGFQCYIWSISQLACRVLCPLVASSHKNGGLMLWFIVCNSLLS